MHFVVRHAFLIAFVSTLAWTIPSVAQTGLATPTVEGDVFGPDEPQRALKAGKVVHAVRIAAPPTIDGRLDDEPWIVAPAAVDLTQRDPDNGQAMTRATRIQFAYDDRYLYVAVTCVDDSGDVVATGLGRRDEIPPTDMVTLAFDPRHDHQTGYAFQTNPSGWQGDFSTTDDDRNDRDYNGVWEVRTTVTATSWTAEFRIPFSQVRFTASPEPGQVWGVNVQRQIRRLNENGTWVAKPRGQRGEVSLYGHLIFEQPIAPPRRLELTPYVAARTTHQPDVSQDSGASTGIDMRLGIGTGATLSATVNPDFGQVEQDPAVLNLSVFETFYPEKRPFFLEDSRTFVPPYGNFQLFHSRRIGRTPGHLLTLDSGELVAEKPNDTTILGAAKLTGKSYAFNRDLTLQAYVQPFVAVGDYSDIRKLALPYSYLFSPVTISYDPDFNTKSLRANVVLRWEYVRGSTIFVVWDLSQADYSRPGVFRPWSDLGAAFGAEPTHTLMVKVSYWINQ